MQRDLIVRPVNGKGRGVFAGRNFRKGEIIEVCPVIPMTSAEANGCSDSILDDYFFAWGKTDRSYAILLGYGGLYNHGEEPNADYSKRLKRAEMVFRAARNIKKGEQICIDYGWPKDKGMPRPRVAG